MDGCNTKEITPKVSLPWTSRDRTSSLPDKGVVYIVYTKVQAICQSLPYSLSSTASLVMHHRSVGTHLGHENYIYTNLCKSTKKSKPKDFNSSRNEPLIVIDYWSKNTEKYFHLRNPDTSHLAETSTTQDVTTLIITTVKHVNYMEQGMTGLQDKFI